MRRSIAARLLSMLLSFWMVAVLADPGVLHACPEHGGHAAHGAHVMHHHSDSSRKAPKDCTCGGSCCAAPNVTPAPLVAAFTVSASIIAPVNTPTYRGTCPAVAPERLLPFANGPPTA